MRNEFLKILNFPHTCCFCAYQRRGYPVKPSFTKTRRNFYEVSSKEYHCQLCFYPLVKVFETVPIAYATARAIIVALAYAIVFLSVTLGSFRRAEVLE
jgi:hypothetical protein